ncbi:MAG: anti-sigma factor family protein [Armatimonadota bacterium]
MNCKKARRTLSDYVDNVLPRSIAADFENHIKECPGCAAELDSVRSTIASLRSLAVRNTPVDLWPRVRRAVQSVQVGNIARPFYFRPAFIAPAITVTTAAVAMLLLPSPRQDSRKPDRLSSQEYHQYISYHAHSQQNPFVDSDVVLAAVELDKAKIRTDGNRR